jgi:hypothetical protein
MAHHGQKKPCSKGRHRQRLVGFEELVRIIGYQLTAFVGSTDVRTVVRWLHEGVPETLQPRMEAALEIAEPIERVESELVAQGFLAEEMCGLAPYRCAAEMLRAGDVRIARAVLTERARKEFLENVAADLEGIELRLRTWILKASLPPRTAYSVHLSPDRNRLWLQLIHTGFPVDQQREWDRGQEWPCWDEVIQEIPEIATARTTPDLQTGFPFKYLRRTLQ